MTASLDPAPIEPPDWETVLVHLKGQMPKGTFDGIFRRSTAQFDGEVCLVSLANTYACEWSEHRLRPVIERAVAAVAGRPLAVRFQVRPQAAAGPARPDNQTTSQLAGLDYHHVWFGKGVTTGFFMRSLYVEKFWQAYLGRAYSLWSFIQSDNRQNQSAWTAPKKYRIKYLARSLGCGFATIRGGLRPCDAYEKSKLQGDPFSACCGRYAPVDWDYQTTRGEQQCMHWNSGLLERLYEEGLLAVELKAAPGRPNAHQMRLQVWTLLPFLTPYQVSFLSDTHQTEHTYWLEKIALKAEIDVSNWETITAQTLAPLMQGYNEGRALFDVYQPNPLLKAEGEEIVQTA
jgi:hypothetical protein